MDTDVILFVLCMWASVATGVAIWCGARLGKAEFLLVALTFGIRKVAEGKASVALDANGDVKLTKLGD